HMSRAINKINEVVDVTNYPHVEELLAISDILITDYSSIAYDYQLTSRPIVRFVTDEDSYVKDRGLYESWDHIKQDTESMIVRDQRDLEDALVRALRAPRERELTKPHENWNLQLAESIVSRLRTEALQD